MNKTYQTHNNSQDPKMTGYKTPPKSRNKTSSCSNWLSCSWLNCWRKLYRKPTSLPKNSNVRHLDKDPEEGKRTTVIEEQPSSDFTDGSSCSFEEKMKNIRKTMKSSMTPKKKLKVGIFTRSAECDYEWLKKKLESEKFHNIVETVQSFPITNYGSQQFSENVARCKFAIIYHTQNRGRINITDVADSLYDMELQYLSEILEKKNVIVVIDDLSDSSEAQKKILLESQPSQKKWADDIFLFSKEEKRKF